MSTIHDFITARDIAAYWEVSTSDQEPYLGETLFPSVKQLSLDLSWIKGSKGISPVLKPSAFDVSVTLRDRGGFEQTRHKMPFFKEAMLIPEETRQELLRVIAMGNQDLIRMIQTNIFDDTRNLIEGARSQIERMRMSLLTTGLITIHANGVQLDYDYGMESAQKVTPSVPWSDPAAPLVQNIVDWMRMARLTLSSNLSRAVVNSVTWGNILQNQSIKIEMNPVFGSNLVMTEPQAKAYFRNSLGINFAVYDKLYVDEQGVTHPYIPDGVIAFMPDGHLGNTYFGTTPEEADLMSGTDANVNIVNTGMAVTTTKTTDPVSVQTKVSMVTLPSFPAIDKIVVADVL